VVTAAISSAAVYEQKPFTGTESQVRSMLYLLYISNAVSLDITHLHFLFISQVTLFLLGGNGVQNL